MAEFDKHNIRFKFQIVDENDHEVLWNEDTYILVNSETYELSIDSVETFVYSALRHLPAELRKRDEAAAALAQQEAEDAAADAEWEAQNPRTVVPESVTDVRSKIAKILSEG